MVETERGDAGDGGALDHVGRVEAAAHADFQHQRVGGRAGEGEKGGGGGGFEEARGDVAARVEHFAEQRGERLVLDQACRRGGCAR